MTYFERLNGVNWYYVLLTMYVKIYGAKYSDNDELYYQFDKYKVIINKTKIAFTIASSKGYLSAFTLDDGWGFTHLPNISNVKIK